MGANLVAKQFKFAGSALASRGSLVRIPGADTYRLSSQAVGGVPHIK